MWRIRDIFIGLLGYEDDVALVDLVHKVFRERVNRFATIVKHLGMEMSSEKTKTMMFGRMEADDSLACEACGGTEQPMQMAMWHI